MNLKLELRLKLVLLYELNKRYITTTCHLIIVQFNAPISPHPYILYCA